LDAAGCKTILIEHDGPFASELVAELPADDLKRKSAFDAANDFCNQTGDTPPIDKGQTYLEMGFSMYYAPPPASAPSGSPTITPRRGRRGPGVGIGPMNSFQ
jgi:hypothetical protein